MFSKMGLKKKLLSLSITFAAITLSVGVINLWGLKKVLSTYQHVESINMPNTIAMANMQFAFTSVRVAIVKFGLPDAITPERHQEYVNQLSKGWDLYKQYDKAYQDIPFVEGEETLYKAVDVAAQEYKSVTDQIVQIHQKAMDLQSRKPIIDLIQNKLVPLSAKYNQEMSKLMKFQEDQKAAWVEAAHKYSYGFTLIDLVIMILAPAGAIILGVLFSTHLSKQLFSVVGGLQKNSEIVQKASVTLSGSSRELSSSTNEQAAALQETVAAIDEVNAMVQKNAESARESRDVSLASTEVANRGKQAVDQVIQSIEEINSSNHEITSQIEQSNTEIGEIVKVIAEIGQKTKVINDIVFQTKLLSFNASVEAARAGDHGKGFAVVAEEVGNLAQMSGNAAKEISEMLDASIKQVEGIVSDTKNRVEKLVVLGKEKVQNGTVTAQKCGAVLDEIVENVGKLNDRVAEISSASSEQAQGIQEITKAMSQMDTVTQRNANLSLETATSSKDLTESAQTLAGISESLLVTLNGDLIREPVSAKTKIGSKTQEKAKDNVVQLQKAKKGPNPSSNLAKESIKKAVGIQSVPSEDDPRFKDL